jgi:hypothetical protein
MSNGRGHAANRRPTPYPEPRIRQVWTPRRLFGVGLWRVTRVWRKPPDNVAGNVELVRLDGDEGDPETMTVRGSQMLSEWTRVTDPTTEEDTTAK